MKKQLIKRLKEYEESDMQLSVKWNGGGDETIIQYQIGDKYVPYDNDTLLIELTRLLVEKFDIPNVGEYYNEGGGIFSVDGQERVSIIYDEFAYGDADDDEIESESMLRDIRVPSSEINTKILEFYNQEVLNFYGTISFLSESKNHLETDFGMVDMQMLNEHHTSIKEKFKEVVLNQIKGSYNSVEITYSGKMDKNHIYFDEIYKVNYFIDKNHNSQVKILFQ